MGSASPTLQQLWLTGIRGPFSGDSALFPLKSKFGTIKSARFAKTEECAMNLLIG